MASRSAWILFHVCTVAFPIEEEEKTHTKHPQGLNSVPALVFYLVFTVESSRSGLLWFCFFFGFLGGGGGPFGDGECPNAWGYHWVQKKKRRNQFESAIRLMRRNRFSGHITLYYTEYDTQNVTHNIFCIIKKLFVDSTSFFFFAFLEFINDFDMFHFGGSTAYSNNSVLVSAFKLASISIQHLSSP